MKQLKKDIDKRHNKNRTKAEIVAFLDEMKNKHNEKILYIEANKRRVNLSLNEGLLRLIEEKYQNKSGLIENLLVELLEKEMDLIIKLEKSKTNYK